MKRGRPRKTAQVTQETAQKPSEPTAVVVDTPKPAKALQPILDKLDEVIASLAVFARLAAVDTVHTAERPETLFKRAITEASIAANVIAQTKTGGAA